MSHATVARPASTEPARGGAVPTITITYHVRPFPGTPPVVTVKTEAVGARLDRVMGQWADHVRRQFGSSTTRETATKRMPDGSYKVGKRQSPGGILLATITTTPE